MFFQNFRKFFSQKLQNKEGLNFNNLFHIYDRQIDQILEALASVLSENFIFRKFVLLKTPSRIEKKTDN